MIYPLFSLVLLTYVILLVTLRIRVGSVRSGALSIRYFSVMQGQDVPDMVLKSTRHFANLFEVPVLFYAAGVLYIALDLATSLPVLAAWTFVVARVLHSLIHMTYNNIMHRLLAFGFGNLSVLVMWVSIVLTMGGQASA